jgi:lipopolysaccharide transport system ATP-binding protein
MAQIELDHVDLTFRVRRQKGRLSLKEYLLHGLFLRRSALAMEVHALKDLSVTFSAGERVGILGPNGAGKSSLLKLLAGVYHPTRGNRRVQGKISSLFDLMLGFDGDASGWDNIRYRGYLQGETPASINAKMQEIAEFSELGDFLDTPVRYYSAGMLVRLAFAISTAIEPEILLVDEVLTVGDMAFQEKAGWRMREMMAQADLIVVISHDLNTLSNLCDRGIWLDHGQLRLDGPIEEVIDAYTNAVHGQPPLLATARPSEPDRTMPARVSVSA